MALLLLAVAFASWLGMRAFEAKSNLEQAQGSARQTKDLLAKGDAGDAARSADEAASHARAARDATHSLPWNVVAAIPWLGSPFKTGQQISDVVLGLASDVLQPAAQLGGAVSPDRLLANGRLDVHLLRDKEPQLSAISDAASRLDASAEAISDPAYLDVLRNARSDLQRQTSSTARLFENTALAARLIPAMTGADGPRSYFMGFQTNAEARGTGGLLGGFGILRFDDGSANVEDLGANAELDKQFTPIDLGLDYAAEYGFADPSTDFRNSNLSSHFPYAAQIWKSMWEQQTGSTVDGVIAIDPVALSYILGATGPMTMPDGEVITADNVVELTESTAYIRFPLESDQAARKTYLQDVAKEVAKKVTGPVASPQALLEALGKAVSERRIAVWSTSPDEQKLLDPTPLAHAIPDDSAPYAEVVINNLGGNKLDYYLKRTIKYDAGACGGETRLSTVTIGLTSTVPGGLPDFMAGSTGFVADAPINIPIGTMLTSVRLIATKDATLVRALANGQPVSVFTSSERGHPGFEVQVAIPPGKSGELTFQLSEPTTPGAPRVPIQPLVDAVAPVVTVPSCSG